MDTLHFRVSSGIKSILGRDMITSDNIAIFELVKNGFDARATKVSVSISINREKQELSTITIIDNGSGMSFDDIVDKWLFIAYSEKVGQPQEKYAGSKGIGRFSCDRLGSKLSLITKKDGHINSLQLDWDEYEQNLKDNVQNIPIRHYVDQEVDKELDFQTDTGTGTKLVISCLRNQIRWITEGKTIDGVFGNYESVIELHAQLEALTDPFVPSKVQLNLSFSDGLGKTMSKDVGNSLKASLDVATTKSVVHIGEKEISVLITDKGKAVYSASYRNQTHLSGVEIQLFFMDRVAKARFKRKMHTDLINYGNIFVYKNGFRIMPFGLDSYDAFEINKRKTQGTRRYFGLRDLLGCISIEDPENHFIETSSRDNGFEKSLYSTELRECYFEYAQEPLEQYAKLIKFGNVSAFEESDTWGEKTATEIHDIAYKGHAEGDVLSFEANPEVVKIPTLREKLAYIESVPDLNQNDVRKLAAQFRAAYDAQLAETKQLKKDLSKEQQQSLRLSQEIENQSLLIKRVNPKRQDFLEHELNITARILMGCVQNLSKLTRSSPGKNQKHIEEELATISTIVTKLAVIKDLVLRVDLDTKRVQRIDLLDFIREYVSGFGHFKKGDVKVNLLFEEGATLFAKTDLFDFGLILDNFYDNADKLEASKLDIYCHDRDLVFVTDTGNTVTPEIAQRLFELGFSATKGTGYGLYIVKSIVEANGWTIKFVYEQGKKDVSFVINVGEQS
jgi:signal transduction histidine kinase